MIIACLNVISQTPPKICQIGKHLENHNFFKYIILVHWTPNRPTSSYVTPKVPTDEIYRTFLKIPVTLKRVYDQKLRFTIFKDFFLDFDDPKYTVLAQEISSVTGN